MTRATILALDDGKMVAIPIDVVLNYSPSYQSSPTMNAVEDGSRITDHVENSPESLTIVGFIGSDIPKSKTALTANVSSFLASRLTGAIRPLNSAISIANSNALESSSRVSEAYQKINDIWQKKLLVELVTEIRPDPGFFKDMIIQKFSPTFDLANGDGMQFSLTLQRVELLSSEFVTVQLDLKKTGGDVKKARKQATERNMGLQSKTPVVESNKEPRKSLLSNVLKWGS